MSVTHNASFLYLTPLSNPNPKSDLSMIPGCKGCVSARGPIEGRTIRRADRSSNIHYLRRIAHVVAVFGNSGR